MVERPESRRDPDTQVEAVADEIGWRVIEPDLQIHGGMLLAESANRCIEPSGREGVGQGHAKTDGSRRPVRTRRFRLDPVEIIDDLAVKREELLASVGKAQAPRGAIQQTDADRLLQFTHHYVDGLERATLVWLAATQSRIMLAGRRQRPGLARSRDLMTAIWHG